MSTHQARKLLLAAVALLLLTASAAIPDGQARIASWYQNLDAAVSLRFDDGLESHATKVIPQLNRYGFRAIFLVSPGSGQYRARRDFWEKTVPAMGHRLGNHTMNHRGARTVEEADYEIGEAARTIWRVQPRESKLLVFASGGGKKLWGGKEWDKADPVYRQLVQKYHLIDLYDGSHPYLSVRSGMGSADLCRSLDATLAQGGHQSYEFHDIGRSSFLEWVKRLIRGYGMTISEETFSGFLGCLDERRQRFWVAPLDDILKYEEEARDAAVRTTRSDRHSAILQLSVRTDPVLYDHPLTLILFSIPWNLDLMWSYSINQQNPQAIFRSSTIMASMGFNLTEAWKFNASTGYDMLNRQVTAPQITIYRVLHCWEMNFSWVPVGQYRNFRVEIRLKAPQLQDLKLTKQGSVRGFY